MLLPGGWDVVVISEERNRALAESFSLSFRAIAGDLAGIVFEEEHAEMLVKGRLLKMIQEMRRVGRVAADRVHHEKRRS